MAHSPPYCTAQDMLDLRIATQQELLQLTDTDGLGVMDESAIAAAAETAAIEIDPYLAGKTTVPLVTVPDAVRRLACVLTRFYLYTYDPPDHIQRQYDAALRTLREIASGGILIGAPVPAPAAGDGAAYDAIAPVWGRDRDTGGLG